MCPGVFRRTGTRIDAKCGRETVQRAQGEGDRSEGGADVAAFLDRRIDDIMISYASDQGGVGPHTDDYDVFLMQALGRRRWQLSYR